MYLPACHSAYLTSNVYTMAATKYLGNSRKREKLVICCQYSYSNTGFWCQCHVKNCLAYQFIYGLILVLIHLI